MSAPNPAAGKSPKQKSPKKKIQHWPYVRWSEADGNWLVDARTKNGGRRKHFSSRDEADRYASQCRLQREEYGTRVVRNVELEAYGWTVQDAIAFALQYLKKQSESILIPKAIDEMVNLRESCGRSKRYQQDLRARLGRFEAAFPGRTVAEITAKQLDAWLAGLSLAAGTRNTFRRDLRTLFSFCEKRGYCAGNEAKKTERAREVEKPVQILTVQQVAALLEVCDDNMLPVIAISLFAGLRAAEVEKLDWKEIDFESGHIEVTAAKAKTARRRLVPISENLAEWIRPVAKRGGPVAPEALRYRFDDVKRAAGWGTPGTETDAEKARGVELKEWPQNAMRHSYGSYRLATCPDAARVALEMGNSAQIVFAHYREIVKPKDTEAFWNLRPAATTEISSVAA
jgi:integrase